MTETKAIGLTAEPVIYHVRCIETRCTSGIHNPRLSCMYLYRSCSGCVHFPPPPPSKSTNDESGKQLICAWVCGRMCVKVRMEKEGRSELKCNLTLNHIPSQGGKAPLPGVSQWIKSRCGPHFSKVTFPFDSVSGSLALTVESERWN